MSAKRGLGRGFSSLIPDNLLDETFDPTAQQDTKMSDFRQVAIDDITPDDTQPRKYFEEDSLAELAESIKEHGVLQPVILMPKKPSGYIIVAGERRFRAAKLAGLTTIPSLVRTLTAQHKLELSLIENIQRQDLNVLETATAYLKLRDQFNMKLEEIGARVSKSASAISNTMRLLKLPKIVQEAVFAGRMSEGQARPLIGVREEAVEEILEQAIKENWTARKFEQWANNQKAGKQSVVKKLSMPQYDEAEKALTTKLRTPTKISTNSRGAGKIVISFKNKLDFDRIQRHIEG
ncbi:MAG TPA: ParB/RepB/Spo0J family partition protein [Candidatus Saccharibacteria bacterium]|nr:ParB/RepB/Spo0J family partition protein [Candidatus Saccharibacteria bacterium]HMR38118.1 ParB/RepB/Spo0J family partition protein [Candidatus Saccharibacteria bacterium]